MLPTNWRRSTPVLVGAAVLVIAVVVVVVAALVRGGGPSGGGTAVADTPKLVVAKPALLPVAESAPEPTPAGLAATLGPVVANPDLGLFSGRVTDALTGKELWQQGEMVPLKPASTNKTLTAAAALLTLDRDARFTTTVVAPDQTKEPGVVVLVGGGDPTLSSAAPGQETLYRNAARISDLADQVKKSGIRVTSIQVDVSFYSGPTMAPGWDPADILGGDVAPMEPVMVDGGRIQPLTPESYRSTTPALDAGRVLAAALGVDPRAVTVVNRPARDDRQIASVQSPPLIERMREMMNASDNVMAESIGREVAVAHGQPASFAGAAHAVTDLLKGEGVNLTGTAVLDSSGLSMDDRLTAMALDGVIAAATSDDHPKLRPLLDVLPIASGSGTLSNRFVSTRPEGAAGWLRAKTGSLTAVNTLAGVVTDVSGRVLTFALLSNDAGPTGLTSLDAVANALRSCGCG